MKTAIGEKKRSNVFKIQKKTSKVELPFTDGVLVYSVFVVVVLLLGFSLVCFWGVCGV